LLFSSSFPLFPLSSRLPHFGVPSLLSFLLFLFRPFFRAEASISSLGIVAILALVTFCHSLTLRLRSALRRPRCPRRSPPLL
jgi:uncharacterized membrane protein YqjE